MSSLYRRGITSSSSSRSPLLPSTDSLSPLPVSPPRYQSSDSHLRDLLSQFSRFSLLESLSFSPVSPSLQDFIRFLRTFHSLPVLPSSCSIREQRTAFELAVSRVKTLIRSELERKPLSADERDLAISLLVRRFIAVERGQENQNTLNQQVDPQAPEYQRHAANFASLSTSTLLSRLSVGVDEFGGFDWEEISSEEQREIKQKMEKIAKPINTENSTSIASARPSASFSRSPSGDSPLSLARSFIESLNSSELIRSLALHSGIHPTPLSAVCLLLLTLFCLYFLGFWGLLHLFAFVYPAYWTFQSLESIEQSHATQTPNSPDSASPDVTFLREWVLYWSIYGMFHISEPFLDFFFSGTRFYYAFKLIFFVWCFIPPYAGCAVVYEAVAHPLYQRYEGSIDERVQWVMRESQRVIGEAKRILMRQIALAVAGGNEKAAPKWSDQKEEERGAVKISDIDIQLIEEKKKGK